MKLSIGISNSTHYLEKVHKDTEESLHLSINQAYTYSKMKSSPTTSSARLQNDFGADLWVKNRPKHVRILSIPFLSPSSYIPIFYIPLTHTHTNK